VSCEPVTRLLYQCVVNEAQHYVPMIVLGMALLAIGGLPFVMWGIFLRTVLGLHGCYQCCRLRTWNSWPVRSTWRKRIFIMAPMVGNRQKSDTSAEQPEDAKENQPKLYGFRAVYVFDRFS
jgi:hypothetical protein